MIIKELHIHNTRSGTKEKFSPLNDGYVGLYCCGPTVYNFAHIGNMRTYIFEDILRRTLEFIGYDVRHVMNITDIGHLTDDADDGEDKMIMSAREQNKSIAEIANFYTEAFLRDCSALNIRRPSIICKATDHIDDMIALIQRIEAKGYCYMSRGNVYFDTARFKGYGLGAQVAGNEGTEQARVAHDPGKRNIRDFVLWFTQSKYHNHSMLWDSPWGRGYPGWHLECSTMSMKYLGEQFDIHCGGIDHVPIHHTNEIAQVESVTEKRWVRYWLHGEFLLMNEGKISKSKRNFIMLSDLAQNGFNAYDFRYLCLGGHYRMQLSFSNDALTSARNARLRLQERVDIAMQREDDIMAAISALDAQKLSPPAAEYYQRGVSAITHDLNSPQLLSVVWGAVKSEALRRVEKLWLVAQFDRILGLDLLEQREEKREGAANAEAGSAIAADEIEALIAERAEARKAGDWERADGIRSQLRAKGIEIIDQSDGSHWIRK